MEYELVHSQENVLGMFLPFIAYIVANEKHHFSHSLIRQTSILTLCRYMSVSSVICESYLPLLFTMLENEGSEAIRTSIVIAMGDLCFRFPNTLEPWICYLYQRLHDDRIYVRYNTLLVLTHLALNDMIKVKGQVSPTSLSFVHHP